MATYPRVYVTPYVHNLVRKFAERKGKTMKEVGNSIVLKGLAALNKKS